MFISFLFFVSFTFSSTYVSRNKISNNFHIPKGLEQSVDFWIDIFTKYDLNEFVLHDSKYNIIYTVVDVSDINSSAYFSRAIKQDMINSRVLALKRRYQDALKLLNKNRNNVRDSFLYSLYRKFNRIKDPNKFLKASKKGRMRIQQGVRASFRKAIYYSKYHLPYMEKIFAKYNLPKDLTRLPLIESFFNTKATSYRKAAGVWQFMPSTGKEYMHVSTLYDERRDPVLSTIAAAKMLKKSYKYLKNWSLAVTGFNYGIYGIKRAKKKHHAKNIVDLIKHFKGGNFGFASKNYYAEFLAAVFVEKHSVAYFGRIDQPTIVKSKFIKIKRRMSFSQLSLLLGIGTNLIKKYNPAIAEYFYNGTYKLPLGAKIRVPKVYFRQFYANRRLNMYFKL